MQVVDDLCFYVQTFWETRSYWKNGISWGFLSLATKMDSTRPFWQYLHENACNMTLTYAVNSEFSWCNMTVCKSFLMVSLLRRRSHLNCKACKLKHQIKTVETAQQFFWPTFKQSECLSNSREWLSSCCVAFCYVSHNSFPQDTIETLRVHISNEPHYSSWTDSYEWLADLLVCRIRDFAKLRQKCKLDESAYWRVAFRHSI